MKRTSSLPPLDGRAGGSPQWIHRRDHEARITTAAWSIPHVATRQVVEGTDPETLQPLVRVILTMTDGSVTETDYNLDGDPMSRSNKFVAKRAVTERKVNKMMDTDLDTGQITEFARITSITTEVDGTVTYGPALDKTPDLTTAYVVGGHADEVPALVNISTLNEDVTGTTPYALTVPPYAAYGEVYIEGENIRWTQDGSAPAPGNGEQERFGTTIKLYGTSALTGFRALPINNVGAIDGSLTAKLSTIFFNANPERGPYSMTVPTVPELIFSYVEGIDPNNPRLSTMTFQFSADVSGSTSNQIVDIGSWGPSDGDDYGSLPTQMRLDLSKIGITSLSDPLESTTYQTWRLHMPGTASDGNFYRFQADIPAGTQLSFPTVSDFATWLMDQMTDSVGTGGVTNANTLVNVSMSNGVLIFDVGWSSMQWDNSGSLIAAYRRLLHPVTTYSVGSVTNAGNPVSGSWSAVGGDDAVMRFTPDDAASLDYSAPLVFDFSSISIVGDAEYRAGAPTSYSLPITDTVPASALRFTPQPISGGDTQLVIDVFYSDYSTTMSSLGDPVTTVPTFQPTRYSIAQPGSWSISGDQLIYTFDDPVHSGAQLYVMYSGAATADGSTGDGATEFVYVS